MKMQFCAANRCTSEKRKLIFLNISQEFISVYLWFIRFSNILLKLVQ